VRHPLDLSLVHPGRSPCNAFPLLPRTRWCPSFPGDPCWTAFTPPPGPPPGAEGGFLFGLPLREWGQGAHFRSKMYRGLLSFSLQKGGESPFQPEDALFPPSWVLSFPRRGGGFSGETALLFPPTRQHGSCRRDQRFTSFFFRGILTSHFPPMTRKTFALFFARRLRLLTLEKVFCSDFPVKGPCYYDFFFPSWSSKDGQPPPFEGVVWGR